MAIIRGFPQGLLNNVIGVAPNNAVGTAPQQAVAAPVQAPPPPLDMNNLEQFTVQGTNYFRDPNSGDVYSAQEQSAFGQFGEPLENIWAPNQLVAKGSDVNNPDFANLTQSYNWRGISNPGEKYTDPAYAVSLSNLKQQNPDQYYKTLATDISDQILGNWSMNKNEHNVALTNQLESIKEKSPAAYYEAQFNLLSKQSGWQHGQNTFERAKPYQEKMTELVPKAIDAGLSPEQIDSIVGKGFSTSSSQNQQFIANRAASGGGGFNLGELIRGVAPVAAFAIGAPFLDAALQGAAAGSSLAGGTAGSVGPGSLEAYMLSAGLDAGTFSNAAFSLPNALSVAPEVTSALNTANAVLPTIPGTVPYTPSAFGTLTPPLTGSGAIPGAMSTAIPGIGLTGALPSGVLVGNGTLGTTLGATYMAAGPGQFAVNALGNAIPASSIGIGGFAPASGLSIGINDALNSARLGKGLLGGAEQPTPQAAAPRPQNIMPRGQVDYSGILNLLQVPSPQRNMYSLLG